LAATGGTGTGYTWTVTSGSSNLAAVGLSLSSGGVLSGTPTAGSAGFTAQVTDSGGNTASGTFSVTINAGLSIVTAATLPAGYAGTLYSQALAATGGTGTGYTWTVTSGSSNLAAVGLSLSSGGVLSGTPTAGSAGFTAKVTDSGGNTASGTFSVTINAGLSIVTAATLPAGYAGTLYSQALAATGGTGTGYTWTVTAGGSSLASVGLSLSSGGVLSGTPTAGSAGFTAQVTDSGGNTASGTFSVTINAGVSIATAATLPAGYAGTLYSQALAATGGTGTGYTWTVTSGSSNLAAVGLSLSSGGLLSGTPTAGSAGFTAKVTDSGGNTASGTFSVTINAGLSIVTAATLPAGYAGTLYSQALAATGGTGTGYTWTVTSGSSNLAAVGLSLSSGGVLSGTPTAGSAGFTAKVTDSGGNTASGTFSVTINAGVSIMNAATLPAGYAGTLYSEPLAATGGTGTGYTWTVTAGSSSLASVGLSLSSGGVLSGTPTAGSAGFTAKVTDSGGNTASAALSVTINGALSITTPATLPAGYAGTAYSQALAASGGTGTGYTWTVTAGNSSLTAIGLSLSGAGVLSGMPTAGSASFTAQVTDSGSNTASATFSVTISAMSAPTTLSPAALDFGNVVVNQTSAIKTVNLTNNQPAALGIISITPPAGGYALDPSTTCANPGSLAAGASCTIAATLTPTVLGAVPAGLLTIATNAGNSPQTVPLTGTAVPPATLSPSAVDFGAVVVNTASTAKTVTLTNNQASVLSIGSVVFGGPFALDTSPSSATTCPQSHGVVTGTLAAGSSCVIGFTFNPASLGPVAGGQITAIDSAANSPQFIPLSGTGIVATTVSPMSVAFGNVVINTTSAVQNVTFTNNQPVVLNFTSISAPAPYAVVPATTTCVVGTPLPANGNCTISLTYSPASLGVQAAASLTVQDGAPTSPQTVSLSGTGIAAVTVAPPSLSFGTVVVNTPAVMSVTLTNNQSSALSISSIGGLAGVYSLNSAGTTCLLAPNLLAAGQSCTIAVGLTATAAGSQPGTLTITDTAANGTQTIPLSANAVLPMSLSPATLTFPAQLEGTTSAALAVTVTNQQSGPLTVTGVTTSGANSNDFVVTSQCPTAPATLPAGAGCLLSVTFTPSGSGTRTAMLTVNNDAGAPQTVTLTGPGNPPVLVSPGSITSFSAPVGTTSAYQTITITNNLSSVLQISNLPISGDFQQTSTTCGSAFPYLLAAGASCNLTVIFDPAIGGVRTGQLQVYDNAVTSPQVVNLSGSGTNPLTISPTSLSFSAQMVGTTGAADVIALTNHESKAESFTLTPAGDFTASTNCVTGVIAANSTCLVYVNFVPSSTNPTMRTGSLAITHSAAVGSPITAPLSGSATTTNPGPAVAVVSPGAGAAGTTVNVVITGNGWTHFNSSSAISFVDTDSSAYDVDITVSSSTLVSPNEIDATLQLTGGADVIYGARNITVTTPLSGGGTETAFLNSAFIIADPTLEHPIVSVAPAFATQGQTLNVNLTAVGTHFVQDTTFANFGDGITVNSLIVGDATDAQANITISNTTPVGYRTITLVTGGEFAVSSSTAFYIGPNNATLLSVSPNVEGQGWSGPVALTASGTHFLPNATQVSITGGIIVGDVNVIDSTDAIAQVIVPANASVGLQNVTVSTGGEIATLNNSFTVISTTPYLSSVSPASGVQGQTLDVVIQGVNTSFSQTAIAADFTGEITVNKVTVNSTSQVTVNITVSTFANVGSITANLISGPAGGATLFPFTFTVTASGAAIISVTPDSVPQGGQLTLTVTGVNTSWVQGTTTATFYPEPVITPAFDLITIIDATHATLNIAVPTDTPPGTYGFYMATAGQIVSSTVTVYANTPTLTMNPANGLVPPSGANSFTVNFTGQFTHFAAATLPVISGEGVILTNFQVTSWNSATAILDILAGAALGPRLVTFTTGGEIVTTYFNVTATPVEIISVLPGHGPQNATMDVAITGLNTNFTSSGLTPTQVIFGGPQITVNSVTVTDATHLTANITTSYMLSGVSTASPPGWQTVYVNTGAEQVMGGFAVDAPASPTMLSVIPSSAQQGSTDNPVTITGSLTNWVQGESELILGAGVTVANLTIISPTMATATISVSPTAPIGGNSVIMITGSEYDSGTGFSVTPGAAYIAGVQFNFTCANTDTNVELANAEGGCNGGSSPSGVPVVSQLQTVKLNVTGVGTHWLQGETTLSFGPGVNIDQLTVTSPTTATAQITVLSSAPVGFAAATAYTDGEIASLQQAIDIEEGSPTLLAISPVSAEQGATLTLQVLGRFTDWNSAGTSAAFNQDITVNSITVIDSETMNLSITVSPWAYVDSGPCGHVLTITTGSEQVSTAPIQDNFCVAQGAEEITGVAPLTGRQGSTETVTITGSATNFVPGVTAVSFGDPNFQVGEIMVSSATSLTVPVGISTSATTGFKTVTVTTYGQIASQQYSFTVKPGVGTLNEAIPNQAEQGVQNLTVQLLGQYTNFSQLSTATFGPGITVNSVAWVSATEVDANISIDPLSYVGTRTVTVTTPQVPCEILVDTANECPGNATTGTGSEIVSNNAFTIIAGPAIITNVSPNTGNEGQEVVLNITGLATHWQQNFTQFYIAGGGWDLTINSVVINSPISATVDMSISPTANPGPRSIYMVTAGELLTDSGAFVVTGGIPVITYLSPNAAEPGTTGLQVTINGLYTKWDTGTTVNFGPGVNVELYTVDDETHISAVIDVDSAAQIGYRTVQVQSGTQILTSNFLVQAPPPPPSPYLWYESPATGIPGQTLTIYFDGMNTEWNPDPVFGTQLTGFISNGDITLNTFQVTSATSALANITISPAATASTSTLTLTTQGTASYGKEVDYGQFTVVVAQPALTIVDPGSGMQGAQNLTVNILGQFTAFDQSTTFSFGPGITVNGPPTILGPTVAMQSISIDQLADLGGRSVVATTSDATGSQQIVSGAGFTVTPSLALISAVTPNTALQGQTITVDVAGQNTHWDYSTTFQFGAGIVVTSAIVNGETDATLELAIPALASEGPTWVTAITGGEIASLNNAFVVQPGTPLLLSSGPGSLPQQSTAIFTILSQATQWSAASPPTVDFGAGIVVTHVIVTGPTSMTVEGYVQPTTYVGWRNLTVTTGAQVLGLPYALYVAPGPAVIDSVSPASGGQNDTLDVIITGINTHWAQGVTQLSFPDVLLNTVTVSSETSIDANITVNINAPAGQVSLTATTLGEVASGTNLFTVIQTQPELLAVVSPNGAQGVTETITLTGLYTDFATATSTADFGAGITVNWVNALSPTSLQANITVQPTAVLGYRNVSVTTGSEVVSLSNAFNVTVGPAAILILNPLSGRQNAAYSVVVTGSQTNFAAGVTTASFGGGITVTGISVTDALHATVNISIPASTPLGAYNVTLTTGGEVATILGGFTVLTGSPFISAVSPPTGHQRDSNLNISLTGQFTHFDSTSTASFGAGITVNSLAVSDATDAVANITISENAAIGSRNVTILTSSVHETASITGGFSVLAGVPALISASPSSGQAGATSLNIVIDGAFTTFQQGFSGVSFGSGVAVNLVTVASTTELTANISIASNAMVGSRDITVTTNGQAQTLSGGFTVLAGTPVITAINPNIGVPGSTLSVTIYGQFTNWVNTVTAASFGPGITVNSTTVNSATNLTASITIPAGAALGPVDVTTTTGAEVETVPGGFTVQAATIPAPSLVSLSPGANAGGMPVNSNIVAVFSQPMMRSTINTGTVLLYLMSNPNQSWIPVPGSVSLDATGRVMTFTPASLLAVNASYYLYLTNGIQDATGNTFNNYQVYLYTADSADITAPTVVAANPPAGSTAGTNVTIQLEFSAPMDQSTQSGMTVSTGGTPVAGSYSWNSDPYCCSWGPGTILSFTPAAPLQPNTSYAVSYGSPLADTAGNALTAGSFLFNTGSGADTAQNYTGLDFTNGESNVGTNFAPRVTFSKPVNPLDINTGTLLLYNADSGKYVNGAVNLAPGALSATFTPSVPLLPGTYYYVHMSWGYYDADGNYLNGVNGYFTTGGGEDLTPPVVASVAPFNGATAVPLNSQVVVHFSSPIDPMTAAASIQVTPAGGAPIAGTATLASDQVTLTFVPAGGLQPATVYTVQVIGYQDMAGNAGAPFSSTFTAATSPVVINVSTGLDAAGNLIMTHNTPDAHWVVTPTAGTPPAYTFSAGALATGPAQPLLTIGPGHEGGWAADGPNSDWVAINPNSTSGNTYGVYSTTFNIPGPSVPSNLCLVGQMGVDDNGELGINGNAITGNISAGGSLAWVNVPISNYLVTGSNTLSLGWGWTDNYYEAFRLQAVIETCGASYVGGLTLTGATPSSGSSGISTNTNITLTFNNVLDAATVNSNTLPVMVGWNSNQEIAGNYAVSGNTVVFTPNSPFPTNTWIYVGACNGPYDLAGDSAGGCYTQLISFQTGSTVTPAATPFQVVAFSPADGATNVGLRTLVAATLNRSVNLGTINSNTSDFGLFAGDSQSPWCGGYWHSQDDATLYFSCYPLPSSTLMTAMLGSSLQDWQGNALVSYRSEFTTSQWDSNTNGSIISTRPGNGAGGVSPNEPITLFSNLPILATSASGGLQVAQNNVALPGTVQVIDNGYALEFTPSVPFVPGALIQWWTTGSLADATYNTPINGVSGYFYVAAATGTLTPTVQVASPPAYTQQVPLNSVFDLQFNTPLNPATIANNVYLYDSSAGLNIPVTYAQPQPNEVLMTPVSDLPANHWLYVEITTGLQSTSSVPASSSSWWEYTGTSGDTTLPVITNVVPYNGAGGVGVNIQPGVVFNKAIDPVSVNSGTFQILNGGTPLAGGYWLNSADTRLEFVPNAPLPANTTLTMILNGVTDQVGHPVTFSSTFTTAAGPDFTAPSVLQASAVNGGSIPMNSVITVLFSESMDATTFAVGQPGNCGNFYIRDQLTSNCIATTLSWSTDQSTAYLTPVSPLAAGRQYYFWVGSGTDLAGNAVNAYGATFYAEFADSFVGPAVVNFTPLNGAVGVGTNALIEAQFSAPIDPTTLSGVMLTTGGSLVPTTAVLGAGNTVLQLVPSAPLRANTTYVITVAGVNDPAGNAVPPASTTFTVGPTYDIIPASVVSIDPPNNAQVGTNAVAKMVFNKPLNPISVSTSTFQMYLNDIGQFIPVTVSLSANAEEVTLTPQIALLPNTTYRFYAGWGLQDQDGNNVNAGWYYFTTGSGAVSAALTVTSVSPVNGASGIPLNAQVVATLSAPIDPTSWSQNSIQLQDRSGNPVAGTVSLPSSQILIFTPTAPLTAGMTYTVIISGFTDANGNGVTPSISTFTAGAAASSGFGLSSSSVSGGTAITNNMLPVTLTFNEILNPATVSADTLRFMDGWNSNLGISGNYAVNGNTVIFTPTTPYPAGATIYVGACNGPTDVLGEVLGGCWTNILSFYVSPGATDTTALQVASVSPASGATNVRHDQSVSVTFNKSISPYSIWNNGNNALLFAGDGVEDRGSISISSDDRTLTFSIGALYDGTTYTIALPAGGITDQSGNTLATTFTSTFTTAANPANGNSSVAGVTPGNGATSVPADTLLTLYINRQVSPATVPGSIVVTVNGQVYAGTVAAAADNYEVQFTPAAPFPNGATVQWWFSNVLDVYGDAVNGDSGTFYTVAAVDPATATPQLIAISPGMGTNNMPLNGEIDLEYSQPIDPTTLSGNVWLNGGPSIGFGVALASPNVIRITPSTEWNPSTWYGFCANGSVRGANGVPAQYSCWADYFTTTTAPDTTPGTVSIGPPGGAINVGTNAYIRLQFSKPVDRTTVNSGTVQVTEGGNPIPGSWSYNYSGGDVWGADFSPVNPLPPSTLITVSVSGILDYAGNEFNEPTATFKTAALPDYTTPNVTLDFGWGQGGIATNASFSCHYSEPMDPSSITPGGTYVWSYVTNAVVPVTYTFSSDLTAVTMTPTSPLYAGSQYSYYCYYATDLTGNGQSNNWVEFYTGSGPSSAGPVVVQVNPPDGMTNVPLNASPGVLFNEPVMADSVNNITLTPQGGSPIPIGFSVGDGNYMVGVQLPWVLVPNTTYNLNLTGVTGLNGNPMTPVTITFATGSSFDWNSPGVTAAVPVNGAGNVDPLTPISVTFSEAMDPVLIDSNHIYLRTHNTQTTVPTSFSISSDYTTVFLTPLAPAAPLAQNTIYDLIVTNPYWCLQDIAGNNMNNCGGQVVSTFTTGTGTAVAGACGSANGVASSPAPASGLCSAGLASAITNPGSWTWTCNGENGGANASCSAPVVLTAPCDPQPSGLVSWWPGNDDATDPIGGNNGILENGVGFALGEVGDAFSLNGSNQYVLIGQPVPVSLQLENAITLSAWIYATSYPVDYGNGALGLIVGSQHDGTGAGATIFLDGRTNPDGFMAPPGHIHFQIGDGSWHTTDVQTQVPLNQWVHIAATREANQDSVVYYNGVPQPLQDLSWPGKISYDGTWFAIGQQSDLNRPFNGLIDEVQVYDRALSAAEVQAIYHAGSSGVCH
jgi:hypothetical protein